MPGPTFPAARGLTDRELFAAALSAATDGDRNRFWRLFLLTPPQQSRWLSGTRDLPRDVRRLCEAILADPEGVVRAYTAAAG